VINITLSINESKQQTNLILTPTHYVYLVSKKNEDDLVRVTAAQVQKGDFFISISSIDG
jgi:hypothetical protein